MNRSLLMGVGIGVVVAAAAAAVASYSSKHSTEQPAALIAPLAALSATANTATPAVTSMLAEAPVAAGATATPNATATPYVEKAPSVAKTASVKTHGTQAMPAPQYGRVVSSTAVVENQRVAREACHDEQVSRKKPVKDEKRVAGAAIGAVIGGILGNQVGDGNGRTIATAAGAVAGGVAGSKIQKHVQDGNTETVTEKRCTTVYDTKEKVLGYDVKYVVGDQTKTQRMSVSPEIGSKLPLQDGRAVSVANRHK